MALSTHTNRFTGAADIPTEAGAVHWTDDADGTHSHTFHKTYRAAKIAMGKETAPSTGAMVIEDAHRKHGVMVW